MYNGVNSELFIVCVKFSFSFSSIFFSITFVNISSDIILTTVLELGPIYLPWGFIPQKYESWTFTSSGMWRCVVGRVVSMFRTTATRSSAQWRWMYYVPSKHRHLLAHQHNFTICGFRLGVSEVLVLLSFYIHGSVSRESNLIIVQDANCSVYYISVVDPGM